METQNDFNGLNDLNELDDLQQQINALKDKVDKQGRLNEKLVKKAIQSKMRSVHHTILWFAILAIAVIPIYIMMRIEDGFSWPFTIFTILFLIGCITSDYYVNRMDVNHMCDDLVGTARKLSQMKKNRSTTRTIGLIICVLWLAWFCYEFYMTHPEVMVDKATVIAITITFLVSAIIGGAIGNVFYRKMQRTNDEMIDQINKFLQEQ